MRTQKSDPGFGSARRERRAAFTLVELLVVIAVIALLVAILLPSLARARAAAKRSVCASNLRQFHAGLTSYDIDFRQYPVGKYNVQNAVCSGQNQLRDNYGLRSNVAFCPTNDGFQLFAGGEKQYKQNYWDAPFAEPAPTTPPSFVQDRRTGYLYWGGNSLHPRFPKWWGWGLPVHYASGFFYTRSGQREMSFPLDGQQYDPGPPVLPEDPITTSVKPTNPSKLPLMKDLSYYRTDFAQPDPHNYLPQVASHLSGRNANAEGTNVLFVDSHVEWQPILSGKSWSFQSSLATVTGGGHENADFWTPTFPKPAAGSYLP